MIELNEKMTLHIYHIDNDSFLYLDRLITRISLRISALFIRLIIILEGTRGIQIVHTLCAEWRPLIFRDESNTQLAVRSESTRRVHVLGENHGYVRAINHL